MKEWLLCTGRGRERVHLFSQHIGDGSGVGEGSFNFHESQEGLGRNKMLAIQENFINTHFYL